MKKITKKGLALVLSFAMVMTLFVALNAADAGAKKKAYVKSLKVSKSSVLLSVGGKATLKATVKVKGKAKKTVKAKANSGSVGVKVGKANAKGVSTITLTGKSAGFATVKVTTVGKNSKKKALSKQIIVVVNPSGSSGTGNNGTSNSGTGNIGYINGWNNNGGYNYPTSVPLSTPTPKPTEEPVDFDYSKDVTVDYSIVTRLVKFKINKDTTTEEELEAEGYTVENGEASKVTECEAATFTFASLPNTLTEIKQIPLDKEFGPMVGIICALATAQVDKYNMQNIDGCPTYEILDYLNSASRGPDGGDSTKAFDQQHLASSVFPNLRGGYQLCFFEGALPTNEYTPTKPLTFTLYVGPYYIPAKEMLDGTARPETHMVLISFGGDDSERYIDVYKSQRDGNWYSYQDQWKHMGAGFKPIQKIL